MGGGLTSSPPQSAAGPLSSMPPFSEPEEFERDELELADDLLNDAEEEEDGEDLFGDSLEK